MLSTNKIKYLKMKSIVINSFHQLYIELYCLIIFVKNYVKNRKLLIKDVQIYEQVLILGNTACLFWKLKGCHKVKVSNIGSFPGTSSGINFIVASNKPIIISFYGVNSIITKQIQVNAYKINLVTPKANLNENFEINSLLSPKLKSKFDKKNIQSVFRNTELQTAFTEISLNFDAFEEISQFNSQN